MKNTYIVASILSSILGLSMAIGLEVSEVKAQTPQDTIVDIKMACTNVSLKDAIKNSKARANLDVLTTLKLGVMTTSIDAVFLVNQESGVWVLISGSDSHTCVNAGGFNFKSHVGE